MKFKIKTYTGTVHTKRPVIKLNQLLRFVSKYTLVDIKLIVHPDQEVSETEDMIFSLVKYIDLRSLSKFIVRKIYSNSDVNGDFLTVYVYDPDKDLPF